jgi:Na+/proline symporter
MITDRLDHIDLTIVGLYFLLTLVIGLVLSKKASQSISDYFLGNHKVPWWAIGMSGTASNFDMTGTMVIISFLFAIGLQGFWVSMRGGMVLPIGILIVYMGKWLRRSNVMTNAEWMQLRFGDQRPGQLARIISAISNLIVTVAFLTYFVKGTGKFLAWFLPFSPEVCSLLMIVFAVCYTAMSGFYGVIYTDVLQEIIILSVSIYVGFKAMTMPDHAEILAFAGQDWSSFFPNWTAESMNWLANPDVYHMFGLCIVFWIAKGLFEGAGGFSGGYMTQRYFAARNDKETSLLSIEWSILLLFRWSLIIGIALMGLSLAHHSESIAELLSADPEKTLPIVLSQMIPAGIRGLAVAGLMAAAMSTFDSTINAGVSYWIKDIYQQHVRPKASEKQLMRQSYLATFFLALIAVITGFFIKNIDEIWSWITGPLAAGLFAPLLMRWYWWRFNGYGFAAATAGGLLCAIILKVGLTSIPFYLSFLVTLVFSFAFGIIGSLLTTATDKATLEGFWRRIQPFGLWGPVRSKIETELREKVAKTNRLDLINVGLVTVWHVLGVSFVISLILKKWQTLFIVGSLYFLLGGLTYFNWYKKSFNKQ